MKPNNCCYICNSKDSQILFTFKGKDKYLDTVFEITPKDDMNWMICNSCGFVYRSPVLEQDEYERLYENYDTDIFANITLMNILIRSYLYRLEPQKIEKKLTGLKLYWIKMV